MQKVVGLFGSCGPSNWREDVVIPILEAAGVEYFNPVVKDWNEEAMKNEARHAAEDKVLLVAITGDTTGVASMAESGYLIMQACARGQKVVLLLEDMPAETEPKRDDKGGSFTPNKTRKLLRQHLAKLPDEFRDSVVVCSTLEDAAREVIRLM